MNGPRLMAAAGNGFLAVALGAFGARGLERLLAAAPDAAQRLDRPAGRRVEAAPTGPLVSAR